MLLPLLGLLALLPPHGRASSWTSPVIYPSPEGLGAGNWSTAYAKAHALVSNMTLPEMNNITYGYNDAETGCVGRSGSVPRLNFPGFCLHDAGQGVRNADGVNGYASGLHVAATWNKSMAYSRGKSMGAEFKAKGVNIALGPVVGPLGRIAEGGRIWEGFGPDPFLTGVLGAQTVRGLQESVIASVKHFVGNEQETNRNPSGSVRASSSNIDDQTMHELYAWPFQDVIQAGAGCVMCSYNRINNTYGCENSKVMNGILKGEMNFQGFVVSDWTAQHSQLLSANAGLDMAMPTSNYWDNDQLVDAIDSEDLNRTRLEDMATRIVAAWYQFGQDDEAFPSAGIGLPDNLLLPHPYIDARDPDSRDEILQEAIEGHVLVKNIRNALPLRSPRLISIFGYDAIVQRVYNSGTSLFEQNWQIISDNLTAPDLTAIASNQVVPDPPATAKGVLTVGGGSGSNDPSYISAPFDEIQRRAREDGSQVFFDFDSAEPAVVASSAACIVFINAYASETFDRTAGLADEFSDQLVQNTADRCNNTIVVLHNAGPRVVDAWVEHENVTAVIFAHLPGQDAGRALASILYGDDSPSGRLPYTVARSEADYGDLLGPCLDGSDDPQCDFREGVEIDYRAFLARNATPRYEFGFGLTYSTFEYSGLSIGVNATATGNGTAALGQPVYANGTVTQNANLTSIVGSFGLDSLYEGVGSITATVRNSGDVAASEVAQLYIQSPESGTRVLRGFEKVALAAGEDSQVTFELRYKDLAFWDVGRQGWAIPGGEFRVGVGKSVLDLPLVDGFTL
ncbi:glycoside hydrolase family 3 protein [Polychaeton citri CBS 116435]|uniref:beta-glucosidase n=1 Tax=Polychaeton citri CBS 116435 TaxID=1314669 RepID=A0A9P4PWW5_9PEZI|nr:glycoside hydrolase family 3 protein [Polychaeton citri CBS 116435]